MEFAGSASLAVAFASPRCATVPRSKTLDQSSAPVPVPDPVSTTWRPAVSTWLASCGSTANGLENCPLVIGGLMPVHDLPPSVVADMAP